MPDNVSITPGIGASVAADEVPYSGDTAQVQLVQLAFVTGAEGSRTLAKLPGDGTNGLLVEPRDHRAMAAAIERLLEDGELRARMASAGSARVRERFTVERMVERTSAVYERLVSRRDHPHR